MWWFLLGGYLVGATMTFLFVGFCCMLGGRNSEMWKPFCYAALWPVVLPMFLAGRI